MIPPYRLQEYPFSPTRSRLERVDSRISEAGGCSRGSRAQHKQTKPDSPAGPQRLAECAGVSGTTWQEFCIAGFSTGLRNAITAAYVCSISREHLGGGKTMRKRFIKRLLILAATPALVGAVLGEDFMRVGTGDRVGRHDSKGRGGERGPDKGQD